MHNFARILLDRNQSHRGRTAFQDLNESIDYESLERKSQQFAGWLLRDGLKAGDRVVIMVPDCVGTVIAFLGTLLAGGVAVMTSSQGRPETIDFKIKHVEPYLVLTQDNINEILTQSRQYPPDTTVVGGGKDVAFMLWTSGTTGHPKAVMHSHDSGLSHCITVTELSLQSTQAERVYSTAKLSWTYGLINGLFGVMWLGATAFLDSGLSIPARVKTNIETFLPTMVFTVPVIFSQIVNKLEIKHQIKWVSSGDRLPDALITRWQEVINQPIYNYFGTTECLTISIGFDSTSVGKPIPLVHTRIVDDDGNIVTPGQVGKLQVRSPSIGLGYYKDEKWSKQYFTDWVTTGDSCYLGADGNMYHMGRMGDIIKIAGHFVNPKVLEETLESHPDVEQAAVVKQTNEHGIEKIVAYVVGTANSINLINYMRQHHDRAQCPRKIFVVGELPRTETGKIQRYKLRDQK